MEKHWLTRWICRVSLIGLLCGCSGSNSDTTPSAEKPLPPTPLMPGPPSDQPPIAQTEANPDEIKLEVLKQSVLSPEQLSEGWVRLFDGQTLTGWFYPTGVADWKAMQGCIELDDGQTAQTSHISTSFQIVDFELMIDFSCPLSTDSGICLRSSADPQDPQRDCIEVSIAPAKHEFPTGSLVKRKAIASPRSLADSTDQWHTFRIRAEKEEIKVWLDNELVNEYTDPNPRRGYISLQYQTGSIRFKNILMRPLGRQSLPTGNGWESAWSKLATDGSNFEVSSVDESLHLRGGPGLLQSKAAWRDFVLQATYQLGKPESDSGVLFRCPSEKSDEGYECQIHHGTNSLGTATAHGPGAIMGPKPLQTDARVVIGDGSEPTYLTVLVEEAQIATWINGVQIVDSTDTREPNDNPRLGFNRSAGPIALQGKDANTDITFSNLTIAPIP